MMKDELLVKRAYLKEIAPLPRTFKKGDKADEIVRIKEWLKLWQLNENDADVILNEDPTFDQTMESLVKEIQKFLNLQPTGVIDEVTWAGLISPLKKAFSIHAYNQVSLNEKMNFFASRHLQYRSAELDMNNIGPWIRSYMGGHDGTWYYWCQGFVCTVLDQAFSSIGLRFDEFYANTFACETMRQHAKTRGLLVNEQQLRNRDYLPQTGDIVLYIYNHRDGKAHHTEIIHEILDEKEGMMRTIGGNTNFCGSRNGVGTFLVDRNYLRDDDGISVEIVKMINMGVTYKHGTYPENARKLIQGYPDFIVGYENNAIVFKDGTKLLFDDHKEKSPQELLDHPDINDQFAYPYQKGKLPHPPAPYQDPGRINNNEFFETMYGHTKEEVEKNLVDIAWCPKLSGEKVKVTRLNGVDRKLRQIGEELDQYPDLKPYVSNIGGTFNWRKIKGTNRRSLHSYGIAIDINVSESNYWQWDCRCHDENAKLDYVNRIPQRIVDIFEKYGFVWGGKWYHYDTMHFEYRPELCEATSGGD